LPHYLAVCHPIISPLLTAIDFFLPTLREVVDVRFPVEHCLLAAGCCDTAPGGEEEVHRFIGAATTTDGNV